MSEVTDQAGTATAANCRAGGAISCSGRRTGTPAVTDLDEVGFAWRVVKISFVVTVVTLAAAILHFLTEALGQAGLPLPMVLALTLVEYLILLVDVMWFLRFVIVECSTLLRAIWNTGAGFRAP
ncbi:MAG: hypothetical protein QOJ91_3097 [Sphingomonadales bacterium]|jgi:hypothetical protein|nr:hypothetical protein [Sphingomonadales bacterium]